MSDDKPKSGIVHERLFLGTVEYVPKTEVDRLREQVQEAQSSYIDAKRIVALLLLKLGKPGTHIVLSAKEIVEFDDDVLLCRADNLTDGGMELWLEANKE